MSRMREYSRAESGMGGEQWKALHASAPSNVDISFDGPGFTVEVRHLSLTELQELLAFLRRDGGAA